MRITLKEGESGYSPISKIAILSVLVDDAVMLKAFAFDDSEGLSWVDCYGKDSDHVVRIFGKVEVVYAPGWTKEKLLEYSPR